MEHPIPAISPVLILVKEKTIPFKLVYVAQQIRVKIKEHEKVEKYQDLARKPKTWNMNVTVVPFIIWAHETISNYLKNKTELSRNKRTNKNSSSQSTVKK